VAVGRDSGSGDGYRKEQAGQIGALKRCHTVCVRLSPSHFVCLRPRPTIVSGRCFIPGGPRISKKCSAPKNVEFSRTFPRVSHGWAQTSKSRPPIHYLHLLGNQSGNQLGNQSGWFQARIEVSRQ
jgi:hypothetical protein